MDRLSTVVIVGAGASYELGLPLGIGLKKEISDLLGNQLIQIDETTAEAIRCASKDECNSNSGKGYFEAVARIASTMPQAISIDNFVNDHRNDQRISICSKIAITRCILRAEENSKIYRAASPSKSLNLNNRNRFNFSETEDTWINHFFRFLTQSCTLEELPERLSKVSFVTFNYDRCIETFATIWISEYHHIPRTQAAEIASNLNIHHPYGHVGPITWEDRCLLPPSFGRTPSPQELYNLSKSIRTFTERSEGSEQTITEIRKKLTNADQVIFLGFGYIDLNLRLLGEEGIIYSPSRIIGTTQGLSQFDTDQVKLRLQELFSTPDKNIYLNQDTCAKTIQDFSRALQSY